MQLSVVLACYNEETNLSRCLDSVKKMADEIVVVDGGSTDSTVSLAKKFKAKVVITNNPPIFHVNKQKALSLATKPWTLQLDADEVVSPKLATEIKQVIALTDEQIEVHQRGLRNLNLFLRHQAAVEKRDGKIGNQFGPYTAFFIPRRTYFLGTFLRHSGAYPDGVIRLVKRGKASFPAKSVHEQIAINGRVGWLQNDLLHYSYPTFGHYIARFNKYTDLEAKSVSGGFWRNLFWEPLFNRYQGFFFLYFRHLGILDGFPGLVWAIFSALHIPISYFKTQEIKRERYARKS